MSPGPASGNSGPGPVSDLQATVRSVEPTDRLTSADPLPSPVPSSGSTTTYTSRVPFERHGVGGTDVSVASKGRYTGGLPVTTGEQVRDSVGTTEMRT